MPISNSNKQKLNKMNRASQNVLLGNLLQDINNIIESGSVTISSSSVGVPLSVSQYGSGSCAVFGNDDGKLMITNYGEIRLSGSAIIWDDLRSPATAINPAGQPAPPSFDTVNIGFTFSASAENVLAIVNQMPHSWMEGTDISPHVHILNTNTDTGNMLWKMSYKWTNVGGIESGSWTEIESLIPASGSANYHQMIEFPNISGSGKTISSIISVKLSRVGNALSDDHTGASLFKEFDIHYMSDTLGSNKEYIKY